MFKVICNYALKTYFRKRSFVYLAIISVVLFISSVMSSFIVCSSCIEAYDKYIEETYGSYTAVYADIDKKTYERLEKNSNISSLGFILNYGTVNINDFDVDTYTISFLDDAAYTSSSIRLLQGRKPQNSTEILLEKSIADMLNVNVHQKIALKIKQDKSEKILNKKVVGIYDDFSAQQLMLDNDSRIWPSVIFMHKDETLIECNKYLVVTSLQDNTEVLKSDNELHNEQLYLSQRITEGSFSNIMGKSTQAILLISVVGIMIIAVISLLSFSSLNSFIINEQVQNLRFLAAPMSIKLLFSIIHLSITFLIALPIGFGTGIGIGYVLSNYLVAGLVEFYKFKISLLGVCVSIFISLFILIFVRSLKIIFDERRRPFERKDKRIYINNSKSRQSFVLLKWFFKSFYRNKLCYLGIILSMMLCFLVLFIGGMFTETINKQYDVNYQDDYKLKNTDGSFFSSLYIPTNPYAGFTKIDLNNVLKTDEVSTFNFVKELNVLFDPENTKVFFGDYGFDSVREYFSADENFYNSELKEYGLNVSGDLYLSSLKIIDDNLLKRILKSDYEKFNKNNQTIVVCKYGSEDLFEIGQKIRLLQVIAKNGPATNFMDRRILELNLYVSDIIELEPNDYLYDKLGSSNLSFICSNHVLDESGIDLNYSKIYLNLKDSGRYTETQKALRQLKNMYPEMKVTSQIENDAERIQLLTTLNIITIVLCLFIFFVCIFNVITIISGRYLKERRLWGTLRAMGINRLKVLILHISEMLFIMFVSIAMNTIFLRFVDLIIPRNVTIFNSYVILGYIASTILICLISTPIVCSFFHKSIVSQLEYIG